MPEFHPDETLLIAYSAGTLHKARAICVAAHLAYCPSCHARTRALNDLGGEIMEESSSTVSDGLLAATLSRLGQQDTDKTVDKVQSHNTAPPELYGAPVVVRKLLQKTPQWQWRKLSKSLSMVRLVTGQRDYEVALQRICAGGQTPLHDHKGEEYTVVLKGSFFDEDGLYRPGDFLYRGPGDRHQPRGLQHEDCICLSAVSDRIRITSPLGWLLTPFLRIQPM